MVKVFKWKNGVWVALLIISIVFSLTSCGIKNNEVNEKQFTKDEQYVEAAIKEVQKAWAKEYQNSYHADSDKTVNIINTRIIKIKDNEHEYFHDVEAIVEFDIFSDYYGSSPYYINCQKNDSVVFHKNGTSEVFDPLNPYRYTLEIDDYSDVVGEIIELESAFNTQTKTVDLDSIKEEYVNSAIEELKAHWTTTFSQLDNVDSDGTLKIINTRLLVIDKNSLYYQFDDCRFKGVKAIVEFELYSDYFGLAPYYVNAGIDNAVWIMDDGSVKMATTSIKSEIEAIYSAAFAGTLFSETIDAGAKYNETFILAKNN